MDDNPGKFVMASPTNNLVIEKEGMVGWLTFNKPVRMNAVSLDMWQAFPDILSKFDADTDIRVLVLKGAGGKAFISGADISQFENTQEQGEDERLHKEAVGRAFAALEAFSKPTLAMIQGACLGGGLAIATACDLRYAGEGSIFCIPAARLGMAYPPIAVQRLLNIVGPGFAKEIFFTAREFTVNEAYEMGLINRIYPSGDLIIYVREICKTITHNAPLTLKTAKASIDGLSARPEEALARELQQLVDTCYHSADYVEGRQAFVQKRRPKFRGS